MTSRRFQADNDETETLSISSPERREDNYPKGNCLGGGTDSLLQPGAYSVRGHGIEQASSNSIASVYDDDESLSNDTEGEPVATTVPFRLLARNPFASELADDSEGRMEEQREPREAENETDDTTQFFSVVAVEVEDEHRESTRSGTEGRRDHCSSAEEATQKASVVAVEADEKSTRTVADKGQYKHRNFKEKLFGDARKSSKPEISSAPDRFIRKRDLISWKVQQDSTTKSWVARVQTNPKAKNSRDVERSLHFLNTDSESSAYEAGRAHAVPQMQPKEENPLCFLCQSKFALFRRSSHCRNCGVCVCGPCSTNWNSKMLPATYLLSAKDSANKHVAVCLACDWLAKEFQHALLTGNTAKVKSLYSTGNVNLRTPYYLEKRRGSEVLYPIHMAITSGKMELVRWMASDRACPLKDLKDGGPLVTGKGRTPLQLALSHLDIFQFLIVDMKQSLEGEDLDYLTVTAHLSSLLKTVSPKKVSKLTKRRASF